MLKMVIARQDGHQGAITGAQVNGCALPSEAMGETTSSPGAWSAGQMHTPAIFKDSFLSLSNICAITIHMKVMEGNLETV